MRSFILPRICHFKVLTDLLISEVPHFPGWLWRAPVTMGHERDHVGRINRLKQVIRGNRRRRQVTARLPDTQITASQLAAPHCEPLEKLSDHTFWPVANKDFFLLLLKSLLKNPKWTPPRMTKSRTEGTKRMTFYFKIITTTVLAWDQRGSSTLTHFHCKHCSIKNSYSQRQRYSYSSYCEADWQQYLFNSWKAWIN